MNTQNETEAHLDEYHLMTPFAADWLDGYWRLTEHPDDEDRRLIKMDSRDAERYTNSDGGPLIVRDYLKDLAVTVRRFDCGADCYCAAEIIAIWPLLLLSEPAPAE